jgi:thiol-disulfide isomerase/thioredoxin
MLNNARSALIIASVIVPFIVFSQELNKKIMDPKYGKEILYGYCDRSGLEKGEYGKLFDEYYDIYEPDRAVTDQLKLKQSGVEILVVLGTWCSDSQEQVPRFFKVLDRIRFDKKSVQLICVSSSKEAGDVDLVNYDIQKVPTFIIYKKGREVGRIIETPYSTIEKDLLMFFSEN